ncbi:MAG: adenine deaminase [Planctomycetes bacterium]|nr:adenine deaminase [Planctomycetota bacterium]
MNLERLVDVAAGRTPADLVLKGARFVNVLSHEVAEADVAIVGERIAGLGDYEGAETVDLSGCTIIPGLIDAHVHIESSMLTVQEFARTVVAHGTTAVVADPHEIANVHGTEGIRYMLRCAKYSPIDVYLTLSSCVPASQFESAGATLDAVDLLPLLSEQWVLGLAEMMNFPAVVAADEEVLDKIRVAGDKIVDGHAPGLSGKALSAYVSAGIHSDHECTTLEEAREKLRSGLMIMIREGSQARNLDALLPLVTAENAHRFCFCTDDKHVDDLLREGQMDHIIRRAVAAGMDPILAVRLASFNAAQYFGLRRMGAIVPGYLATLAVVDDLKSFDVRRVYKAGELVAIDGECVAEDAGRSRPPKLRGSINVRWMELEHFQKRVPAGAKVHVIEVIEDSISTERAIEPAPVENGLLHADPVRDLAKIAVIERHQASDNMGIGLVRGFGMKRGAIASTIAHDAHNIVVVGVNDTDMFAAAVHLVKIKGGLCAVEDGKVLADLPLPIGGLMSDLPAAEVAAQLRALRSKSRQLADRLRRPFMALSFLSLSVIGRLKLTDQGLIDVDAFRAIDLVASS